MRVDEEYNLLDRIDTGALADLVALARSKDPNEAYDYDDVGSCALAQLGRSRHPDAPSVYGGGVAYSTLEGLGNPLVTPHVWIVVTPHVWIGSRRNAERLESPCSPSANPSGTWGGLLAVLRGVVVPHVESVRGALPTPSLPG
jgi:hypothetical protein